MESKRSWLRLDKIPISDKITIKIPTVGEVLDNERNYYNLASSLTAAPFSYMVQLDDMGIDYTTISDWDLFQILFCTYSNQVLLYETQVKELLKQLDSLQVDSIEYYNCLSKIDELRAQIDDFGFNIMFSDLNLVGEKDGKLFGFNAYEDDNGDIFLYNIATGVKIDRLIHMDIADSIRKINMFTKVNYKPGNEHMRKYLLEKERKKLKRNAKKPYVPYLENMVVALVNTSEFPYNYDECMNLSLYNFNQSFKQIQHKINFDKVMIGVYAGTINTSKMSDKDCLTWIQKK